MVRSLLVLSSLALHSLELKKIIYPFVNQTIDKIYEGTNHSFIIHTETNISADTLQQLPILLYRPPHYIILTHSPIQFHVSYEFVYKKDNIIWYNYKEQRVKLWSSVNHAWYESCDYPYRSTNN
jgi:hypothetical protein